MIAPEENTPDDSSGRELFKVTEDGLLALTIRRDVDGEELLGFHGFEWTILLSEICAQYSLAPEEAVGQYIDRVLSDVATIALLRRHGELVDVWITDSPQADLQYLQKHEELQFRNWSGKEVPVS